MTRGALVVGAPSNDQAQTARAATEQQNNHNADARERLVMRDREEKIAAFRRRQTIAELERKWNKARGRWSNRYWAVEWIDLSEARAQEMWEKMQSPPSA